MAFTNRWDILVRGLTRWWSSHSGLLYMNTTRGAVHLYRHRTMGAREHRVLTWMIPYLKLLINQQGLEIPEGGSGADMTTEQFRLHFPPFRNRAH